MRLLPCGDRALLAEVADAPGSAAASTRRCAGTRSLGRSSTCQAPERFSSSPEPRTTFRAWPRHLLELVLDPDESAGRSDDLVVEVRYDGPDLQDVATSVGISPDDVVERHTTQLWTVEFAGFAPEIRISDGIGRWTRGARRASPRTRIPAGSVGLAGPYSGIYPRASPGGWQLIGRSDAPLWDADRDPPALLTPGRRVRFVEVGR
jgi:allophanate hydrolase subunit 1